MSRSAVYGNTVKCRLVRGFGFWVSGFGWAYKQGGINKG